MKRGRLIYIYTEDLKFNKRFFKDCFLLLAAVFAAGIICPEKACAYLDPGTGSMILQVILAGVVGIGCTFKVWRDKIIHFFKRDKGTMKFQAWLLGRMGLKACAVRMKLL